MTNEIWRGETRRELEQEEQWTCCGFRGEGERNSRKRGDGMMRANTNDSSVESGTIARTTAPPREAEMDENQKWVSERERRSSGDDDEGITWKS